MKRLLSFLPLALIAGCAGSPTPPDPASAARIDEARRLVAAGNYEDALTITDGLLAKNAKDKAARLLAADANIALARAGRGNPQAFLLDAVHNLEVVCKDYPNDADAHLRLADGYLKTSEFMKGRDAAMVAANLHAQAGAGRTKVAEALLAAADNEMQLFVDARRPELAREEPPGEDSVRKAQAVLAHTNAARTGLPGKAAVRAARVYQWLNQHEAALAELERGIAADPSEPEVHVTFQDVMLSADQRVECVAAYKRMMRDQGDSPTMLFYFGRAQYAVADSLRGRGQFDDAAASYTQARDAFGRYLTLRTAHKRTATHWQAMVDLSLARMALDRGQRDAAKAGYFKAFETDPRVLTPDADGVSIVDSFGGTYAGGLFLLGTAIAEGSDSDSLERALAFFEEVIAKHPDAIGQFYNNAGLAARDLGVQVAKRDEKAAMALWERSYRHYQKAVELVPDDPRIVNDCGLMLIYHLHRDLDVAKQHFDRAIELGEDQLARLPADASDGERHFLEEAVGDAYQNLGILARQQGKPFSDYKAVLEKAVRFYPYQRRTAAQLLRNNGAETVGLPGSQGTALTPKERARREQFAATADAAGTQADAGDFDAALLTLDGIAGEFGDYAPYHTAFGRYSLLYAEHARGNGGTAGQIDGLYADALSHLRRARELDGEDSSTRFWLLKALIARGDFAAARTEADSLLSHLRSRGDDDGVDVSEVHALRAQSAARTYIAAKQAGDDDEPALRGARESFRLAQQAGKLDATGLKAWLALEQWAGAPGQALEVAMQTAVGEPLSTDALEQAIALGAQLGESGKVADALGASSEATRVWYRGRARFNQAQEQWADDKVAAVASLDAAIAAFAASKSANPGFADSCEQWTALSLASKGVILLSADRIAEAEATLLQSLATRPDCAATDLGGGNSAKRGILVLGGKYAKNQAKLEALMRAATTAVPGDVDFANNHGLAARDRGVELERAGDTAQAKAMFEASYASYVRASDLEPDNVRLRNDCALLLVYHLHRDLDGAVSTLEAARDAGKKQLEESPPSDAQARRDLEEAVGDCIENLGYYYDVHAKDPAKARPHYEEALAYYPKAQRAATRRLQRLGGGGGR